LLSILTTARHLFEESLGLIKAHGLSEAAGATTAF